MEAKNVMLLGFVNRALEYLSEHLNDELDASLMELKNIDLDSLKAELNEEMHATLDTVDEGVAALMQAGKEAFDKFVKVKKEEDLSSEFDRMFDVDLDEETSDRKDDLKDLLAFYDLPEPIEEVEEEAPVLEEETSEEEKAEAEEVHEEEKAETAEAAEVSEEEAAEEETVEGEETTEEVEALQSQEETVAVSDDASEEGTYELDDEESKMLQMIADNVNRKPEEEKEDVLTGANSQLDTIFSELVAAEEEINKVEVSEERIIDKPVILVDDKTKEVFSQYIENPLIDLQEEEKEEELIEEKQPNPDLIFPEQVDKDDIIRLIKEIQPLSDVYYNKIENFIDLQEKQQSEEYVEKPKQDSKYVSSLIDDLKAKMTREEDKKREEEETYRQIYDRIHSAYPYLSNAFIRNVYELKEAIANEYPLGETIVVLHRSVFKNVENLRQYVEIALKHDYAINADEKKMIVDVFKQYVNTDGKIITSIFEVANQSALLDGEYEGYRVLFEEDLQ
ncbi:MAG: hypothetical protein IJI46_10655 [Erysipelotrichaceae bacterium]|nr:hypothetical protein [Erysipelotrichaceae bacterium]